MGAVMDDHVRLAWADLPVHVRRGVEALLGAPVVEAVGQTGGFSPGTADRVRLADGRRAFVKAAGVEINPRTVELHRREAEVTAGLPSGVPAPALLGCYDEGDWIALVMQDVAGRQPATPWDGSELAAALVALEALASAGTPAPPVVSQRPAGELLGNEFAGWKIVAADPPPDLDPWAAANLDRLIDLAASGVTALRGDTLCHTDIRADNLLIDDAGRVTIVDWPWATTASAWFDALCLVMNVRLHGGHETDALLARSPLTASADPDDVTAVLAGLAGGFADLARQPPPPGIPTVRAFQRRHADLLLDWVRARL
jgi:hypothetical protein